MSLERGERLGAEALEVRLGPRARRKGDVERGPAPAPAPRSASLPVPGQRPRWCREIVSTAGSSAKTSCVPLPWCTSQSRMHTRSRPCARAALAATATAFVRQKPIGRSALAWCPGGRTAQNAADARPSSTSATASQAAPAASRVARIEPGPAQVSGSSQRPCSATCSSAARYSGGCTRSSSAAVASRASRSTMPTPAARAPPSAEVSRAGDSGCPPGWRCAAHEGWESRRMATSGRYRAEGHLPKCDVFAWNRFDRFRGSAGDEVQAVSRTRAHRALAIARRGD